MRRALLSLTVVLAALAIAAPASAAPPRILIPATGAKAVFVAYGTGTTVCDITVAKRTGDEAISNGWYPYYSTQISGKTNCNAPVQQTGRATVPASGSVGALDAGLCSTTGLVCESAGKWQSVINTQPVTYRMTLKAPDGQGWLGAPTNCSGVGTDNLSCSFELNDVYLGQPIAT